MFDFDAGKERLSILSKYVRLPRSAEHGEVTASLLYERLVMAAIAASKSGSLFSTDGGTTAVGGQYALVAFAALIGGAGGTALMWAILNRKKPSKAMTEGTEA